MPKVIIKKAPKANHGKSITPLDSNTVQFNGPSHKNGGMMIEYAGQPVEVEGAETGYFSPRDNSLHVMGNMTNPLTGRKFKQDSKKLADKEKKVNNLMEYSYKLIDETNTMNKWDKLKLNSGMVMMKGAAKKKSEISQSKEWLATIQNAMLERADELGADPQAFSKGKLVANKGAKVYANGGDPNEDYKKMVKTAAAKYNVDPKTIERLMLMESGMKANVRDSRKGAIGIMQFMENTAKKYGITKAQLRSTNPADVEKVIDAGVHHFKDLLDANNNDYKLALAAYNGGQGAVDFVKKKLGKKTITGDEWVEYMSKRQEKKPNSDAHAWHNETLDYVTGITGTSDTDFVSRSANFKRKYYDPDYDKLIKEVKKDYKIDLTNDPETIQKLKDYKEKYNPDKVEMENYILSLQEPKKYPRETVRKGLSFDQIVPELYSLATNQQEPVWMQQINPQLYQPYQVSFQDRLNENNATFSALTRAMKDDPEALAVLAAQKYSADSSVLADEFRFNQAVEQDVINKNITLLNDANEKNLNLADIQYQRQSRAKSITKDTNRAVLSSIADKVHMNRYEQLTQGIYENLYPHYTFDENTGEVKKTGAPGQDSIDWMGVANNDGTNDARTRTEYNLSTGKATKHTVINPSPLDTAIKEQRLFDQQQGSLPRRLKNFRQFNYNNLLKR